MTSTQAGARVRRILEDALGRPSRGRLAVGHFGTLDPDARGMLPLGVGNATRLFPYIADRTKRYTAVLVLGQQTNTGDAGGLLVHESSVPTPSAVREKLPEILHFFQGSMEQIPPMVSAVHHEGKRLYELARAGQTVVRKPRPIEIHELILEPISERRIRMSVHCSEGTYIRTLCEDIAVALGTVGHMDELVRERAGPFALTDARTFEEIAARPDLAFVDPVRILGFPTVTLGETERVRFHHGQVLAYAGGNGSGKMSVVDRLTGELLGIADLLEGNLIPRCVLR